MYSCTHVFMYSCIHVLMYSCTHVFMYSRIHVFMYSYTHVLTYSCIHVLIYSCTHVFMYSCTHVLMYSCILARLSLKGTKVQKRKKGRKTCGQSFKNDNLRLIFRRSAINERVIVLKVYFKCAAFRLFVIDLYVRKKW
jgi:hypothetical protein